MTLPPERLGDKGQRYEVRATGYPHEGTENVIGWSDSLAEAKRMASAILLAPRCMGARIVDRGPRGIAERDLTPEITMPKVDEDPGAPIAKVTIGEDFNVSKCDLYAPGLPPGEHDLYCVPVQP